MATGPSGPIGGGHVPLSAEWLRQQAKAAKKAHSKSTGETEESSELYSPSDAAKGLAVTKDEKMLQAMKAELAKLDPESESFMEEATGKLIDSVIDQEYGESFKDKPGYENLQEKLLNTILDNETTREAIGDFLELLLIVEEEDEFEDDQDEPEDEDSPEPDDDQDPEEE